MHQTPPRYQTYLLTMWEERSQNPQTPPVWRFRLEDPRTGEKRGFADAAALLTALEQVLVDKEESGTHKSGDDDDESIEPD